MADLSRITGACAVCGLGGIPGGDFVASELEHFLAVEGGVRGNEFVDARAEQRDAGTTEVAGPTLRCRSCALKMRDERDAKGGFLWAKQVECVLPSRPFGMTPEKRRFQGYVIDRVDESSAKPAKGAGIRCGWRVASAAGEDLGGEPYEVVQQVLGKAELPVTVVFDVPSEEWSRCKVCDLLCTASRLSAGRECVSCGGDVAAAADGAAEVDNWEDAPDDWDAASE